VFHLGGNGGGRGREKKNHQANVHQILGYTGGVDWGKRDKGNDGVLLFKQSESLRKPSGGKKKNL